MQQFRHWNNIPVSIAYSLQLLRVLSPALNGMCACYYCDNLGCGDRTQQGRESTAQGQGNTF